MALEVRKTAKNAEGRLQRVEWLTFVLTNVPIARVAPSRLVPPPLVLNSIGEKTLVADRAHID